jgi:hypothetical protein
MPMQRTYHGSCHCGAVRFEADIDLSGETSKCNCSICTKARFWKTIVAADSFRLVEGEDALTDYQFDGGTGARIHHLFCSRCGVKPFGRGHLEGFGDFVAVSVACLDDATDQELAEAPVIFQNGRVDDWSSAPAETRYL